MHRVWMGRGCRRERARVILQRVEARRVVESAMLPIVGLSLIVAGIAVVVAGPEAKRRWPGPRADRFASWSPYVGATVVAAGLVLVLLD